MERSTRLLLCLSMLGTAACVPDAVTGPAPAAAAPETQVQAASDAAQVIEAAPAPKADPRTILLRGHTSVKVDRARKPLYIMDGVIMCGTDWLSELRAADIESIEVIRGAAAAALYGNRRWDAVVLITTRGGRQRPARH